MFVAGVAVPKLGSVQDRTLRAYMQKKVGQEVAHAKLLAQVAMALGEGDKSWSRTVSNTWNAYTRAMYYKTAEHENLEKDMQEEYKLMANFKPKITLDASGKATVTGLPI